MSDDPSRLARAADSDLGKFLRTYVVPSILGVLVFLVVQAWTDIRASGVTLAGQITEQSKTLADIAITLERMNGRIDGHEWRLNRIDGSPK